MKRITLPRLAACLMSACLIGPLSGCSEEPAKTDSPSTPAAPASGGMMEKGKMEGGAMESGKMSGGSMDGGMMEKGKMEGGSMDAGKMEGSMMEKGKMEGGEMAPEPKVETAK